MTHEPDKEHKYRCREAETGEVVYLNEEEKERLLDAVITDSEPTEDSK